MCLGIATESRIKWSDPGDDGRQARTRPTRRGVKKKLRVVSLALDAEPSRPLTQRIQRCADTWQGAQSEA